MAQRLSADEREKQILEYWDKHQTFKRSVEERPKDNLFVFYDGPPFATGTIHYGHIPSQMLKDAIPRYQTMKGKRVERKWGWDCHGLPIENIIEKDFDLGSRDKIEEYGIDKFNEACRSRVLEYAEDWKVKIRRIGRWVDMEAAYHTMDLPFMESVWWAFSELHKKDAVYEGHRPIHICPRCATPLSHSEVGQGYQDVTDPAVTLKFELKDEPGTFVLAWTTTPWTLPGNMLLAVGGDIKYKKIKQGGETYILASERVEDVMDGEYEEVGELSAFDLVGRTYKSLFPYYADRERAFRIVAAAFVSTEEGTGVVHVAPGFGEDDFACGMEEKLEIIQHIKIDGTFKPEVTDFAGESAKPSDPKVVAWLRENNKLYKEEKVKHSYPHCWRCDTPLLNYATTSWFVKVAEIRDKLLKNNEDIRWVPDTIKHGRFGNWLAGARDWSISRNRYWGTPIPVWKSEDGDVVVVSSVAQLEELSGVKVTDLHKHIVDEITFEKDGKTYTRIPEVFDCWIESGSMPYAQIHYPFENKERFEENFPADFIAEGVDQTRAWFYYLMVMSTWLFEKPTFNNAIVNGIVLADDGKKMSKRLKNYPEITGLVERYGADALRFYILGSPAVHADNMRFEEAGVKEVSNKLIGTLGNVLSFYKLFVNEVPGEVEVGDLAVLDVWVKSRCAQAFNKVTESLEGYELAPAARAIQDFVSDLSQWYVRRSRDRFKGEDEKDKAVAARVLYEVLDTTSKMAAPIVPFISEYIYLGLQTRQEGESVHLENWPEAQTVNVEALEKMELLRELVSRTLEAREEAKVPVRQALGSLKVSTEVELNEEYLDVLKSEVNVQNASWKKGSLAVDLDTEITPELKQLGLVREVGRQVNNMRKEAGLTIEDQIVLSWESEDPDITAMFKKYGEDLAARIKAKEIREGLDLSLEKVQVELGGALIVLQIKKI